MEPELDQDLDPDSETQFELPAIAGVLVDFWLSIMMLMIFFPLIMLEAILELLLGQDDS